MNLGEWWFFDFDRYRSEKYPGFIIRQDTPNEWRVYAYGHFAGVKDNLEDAAILADKVFATKTLRNIQIGISNEIYNSY